MGFTGLAGVGLMALGGGRAIATARTLQTGYVKYKGAPREVMEEIGPYRGFFAHPQTERRLAAVIVLHDKFGLSAHYEDITRRVAAEGFYAFAPDMFSPAGGTPDHWSKARTLFRRLIANHIARDLVTTTDHVRNDPHVAGPVACMGFGWGGTMAAGLAIDEPNLAAAIIYEGIPQGLAHVDAIRARLLLHYPKDDARLTVVQRSYRQTLEGASIDHVAHIYENVGRGFHDDTDAENFDAEAAELAWTRSISFLRESLKV